MSSSLTLYRGVSGSEINLLACKTASKQKPGISTSSFLFQHVPHDLSDGNTLISNSYTCMLSRVQFFVIPWTVAQQPPLSMELSRQEYWSVLPFPPPGDLLNPGIKPGSPTLQADSLPSEPPRNPLESKSQSLKFWQRQREVNKN